MVGDNFTDVMMETGEYATWSTIKDFYKQTVDLKSCKEETGFKILLDPAVETF